VKRVAEAFAVSRSQLSDRLATGPRSRPFHYSKAQDEVPLPLIRELVDGRLTYGYRRVCALLNGNSKSKWELLHYSSGGLICQRPRDKGMFSFVFVLQVMKMLDKPRRNIE